MGIAWGAIAEKAADIGIGLWQGKKQREFAVDTYNATMDTTIQRRVADAKKAGISPRFALGSPTGASPSTIMGSRPLSNVSVSKQTADNARVNIDARLQNEVLRQQAEMYRQAGKRDWVQSQIAIGEATRGDQSDASQNDNKFDYVNPEVMKSEKGSKNSLEAGPRPGGMTVIVDGVKFNVPATDEPAEAYSIEQYVPYMGIRAVAYGIKKYGSAERFVAKLRAALRAQRKKRYPK